MPDTEQQIFTASDLIPIAYWSKDHWSTLAYVHTVMIDCAGFQCGDDAHMRSNRRNWRVMREQFPYPKRTGSRGRGGIVMGEEHGTRLKDGQIIKKHCDWCCLQDAQEEGFFADGEEVEPGVVLHFSDKGWKYINALIHHKANGGTFSNYVPPSE